MIRNLCNTRSVASLTLVVLGLGLAAPMAQARHGSRPWAGPNVRYKGYASRPAYSSYVVHRSDSGAAIGGFLGGLFLGAVLANGAPAGYGYYDSYCGERFVSLNAYYSHCRRHHHPRVIRVVEVSRYPAYRDDDCRDYGDRDDCAPGRTRGYDDWEDDDDYGDYDQ